MGALQRASIVQLRLKAVAGNTCLKQHEAEIFFFFNVFNLFCKMTCRKKKKSWIKAVLTLL